MLVRVECPGVERIVTLAFAAPRGGAPDLLLVAELMGKHSNLVLVEVATGLVVDSLQHVAPPMSRVRTVLPGLPYTPPPASGRLALDALDAAAFSALWRETGGVPGRSSAACSASGRGCSRSRSATRAGRRGLPTTPAPPCTRRCASARRGSTAATSARSSTPIAGCCCRCRSRAGSRAAAAAASMNEAAAAFYAQRIGRRAGDRRRGELRRALGRGLKRLAAEEALRREEAAADGEVAFLQAAAAGLTAAAATVPKGASAFVFDGPAHGHRREVPPRPGARAAAERRGALSPRAQNPPPLGPGGAETAGDRRAPPAPRGGTGPRGVPAAGGARERRPAAGAASGKPAASRSSRGRKRRRPRRASGSTVPRKGGVSLSAKAAPATTI